MNSDAPSYRGLEMQVAHLRILCCHIGDTEAVIVNSVVIAAMFNPAPRANDLASKDGALGKHLQQ